MMKNEVWKLNEKCEKWMKNDEKKCKLTQSGVYAPTSQ